MWWRVTRLLRAATGDDGTGAVWPRLTPDGQKVIDLAFAESRELGHPCLAGEHLLPGILRHGDSPAAALLQARGLDLESAREGLRRAGPALGPGDSPAAALRSLGIDAAEIRQRLEASFGPGALHAAERRVGRRAPVAQQHSAVTGGPGARRGGEPEGERQASRNPLERLARCRPVSPGFIFQPRRAG